MPAFTAGKPTQSQFFVEPGDYKFKVVEADEDTSKTGNDMIKLKLRVINEDGSDGPTLFDYLVFTEKAFFKIDNFLKSCGHHPGEGQSIDIEADSLIGYEGEAALTVEEFEGKKNNKVVAYLFDDEF